MSIDNASLTNSKPVEKLLSTDDNANTSSQDYDDDPLNCDDFCENDNHEDGNIAPL